MLQLTGAAAASAVLPRCVSVWGQSQTSPGASQADIRIEIAPYALEIARNRFVKTIAYNGQVPGPLLRMDEGRAVTVEVANRSPNPELVHWHGQFLPPEVDGSMEEGTPMIAPGQTGRYRITPEPAGFRWYHTHTFAGSDMKRASYTGQHGFVYIASRDEPGRYDQEAFLALHDWEGRMLASADGSMSASYDASTINGRTLGFGEPLRVKQGQRLLLHVLNSSATEPHWIALAGHQFEVIALDGNPVPRPQRVSMLHLSPAERVSAIVTLDHPGVWVLGEVRKHIQAAGMGMVVEYEGQNGKPQWIQPETLTWDYGAFAETISAAGAEAQVQAEEIPLVFTSQFRGHGAMDRWRINGKSYPETDEIKLVQGRRYRLLLRNQSQDDHPVHLHRHSFELRRTAARPVMRGLIKDVVLVPAGTETAVEFTADHPGATLFHCHQQDHMDMGFMMVLRYV